MLLATDMMAWLLAGLGATIQCQKMEEFSEVFIEVIVLHARSRKSGEIPICACAGTVLEPILDILSEMCGPQMVFEASGMFRYSRSASVVTPSNDQNFPRLATLGSEAFLAALDLISESWISPITTAESARRAGATERFLSWIFQKEFPTTPGKFNVCFRLKQVRYSAQSTNLPLAQIAPECGYGAPHSKAS